MDDHAYKEILQPPKEDVRLPEWRWVRPEFEAVDGHGDLGSLSVMNGLVLCLSSPPESSQGIESGVMIGPGLMLTATHVIEETNIPNEGPIVTSFLSERAMRIWLPRESNHVSGTGEFVIGISPRKIVSDIAIVSCELFSRPYPEYPLLFAELDVRLPLLGERLWAVGYRQTGNKGGVVGLTMLVSSGVVTACFPDGRDKTLSASCIEVGMETPGGMSGGPVFDAEGRVVGVVSTSFESEDFKGPTYVTLI